ncbi:multidrug efflux SMR transporter [uncultured Helicobacter sp.]|uniref:DMT family transporter n=1 Tax=uncultured Helicobacter sp. TaxID=175537 RepID=UPI00260290D1|nr:multidrug efflux SMR transporter [uncultured Helicobacter sp.]
MSLKTAYILLVFAILTEVLAVNLMKASEGEIFGYVCVFALLVVSYYFMALSLKRLSISVAYAIWEVLGAVCVVAISIFYFGEELLWTQKAGIVLSFCGIALINYAELKAQKRGKPLVQLPNNVDSKL